MDFAQQQRNPTKHFVGITVVIVLHAIIVYALITGLARKVVDVIKQPIETKIIEEVKPPPPDIPPPPPPPKLATPPPPFIPPPEIQIQTPPPVATITQVTPVAPTVPVAPIAPPAPPVVAPPAPPTTEVAVACPNSRAIQAEIPFPREAIKQGLSGELVVEFTLGANGEVKDPRVVQSSHRVFNSTAIEAVRRFRCTGGRGQDVRVHVPFAFTLKEQ